MVHGLDVEPLVDEINVAALSQLGCTLIEQEGETLIVAEDYRDELEFLMASQDAEPAQSVDMGEIDDDWKAFFAQVQKKYSLDALVALAQGADAFAACAKARSDMPELLLDGINEIAADTIGDLVADENGIFEDYLPEIQKHLIKE